MSKKRLTVCGGCENDYDTGVFEGCTSLEKITLPKQLQTIGLNTFASCSNLKEITIPKDVKCIDRGAFSYTRKLKTINVKSVKLTNCDTCFIPCYGENFRDIKIW